MKIAIFVSHFPAISHTFIDREIAELISRGGKVQPFSLNKSAILTPRESTPEFHTDVFVLKENLLKFPRAFLYYLPKIILNVPKLVKIFLIHLKLKRGLRFCSYFVGGVIFAQELERKSIEHLHVHFANAAFNIAVIASQLARLPVSITVHGPSDFAEPDVSFLREFSEYISGFRFISEQGAKRIQWDKRKSGNHKVINCGISTTQFEYRPKLPNQEISLLSVIRLSEQKNPLMIVRVAEILKNKNCNFKWIIIGSGPLEAEVKQAIAEKKLSDSIELLGARTPDEVKNYLLESNICTLTSNDEGIPVFLMEAMAIGRLVLTTAVGAVTELVEDGVNGFLSPPGNPELMAERILSLQSLAMVKADEFNTVLSSAREKIKARHNLSTNMEVFETWIEGLNAE
jgi:colanic acid/amylovoran biosynthesis glycosyltransferase